MYRHLALQDGIFEKTGQGIGTHISFCISYIRESGGVEVNKYRYHVHICVEVFR